MLCQLNQRHPSLQQESSSHLPGLEEIPLVSALGHHMLPSHLLLEMCKVAGCGISQNLGREAHASPMSQYLR